MPDESFQGFNKQGKGGKTPTPTLSPILKQLFYRLQDGGALQLTPPEKAELLTLYQKAYPAFYGREMADAAARSSWRVAAQRGLRAVGYVVMGILIVFILWGIFG